MAVKIEPGQRRGGPHSLLDGDRTSDHSVGRPRSIGDSVDKVGKSHACMSIISIGRMHSSVCLRRESSRSTRESIYR